MNSRRAFTISSLSVWVLVLFLLVAGAHLLYTMNHPGWQAKALVPYLLMFVGVPLLLAAGFGFAAWLIFRKSDNAGNFVFCGLLLLMTATRLAIMTGVLPKNFSFRGSLPRLSAPGSSLQSPGPTGPAPAVEPARPTVPRLPRPQPPSRPESPAVPSPTPPVDESPRGPAPQPPRAPEPSAAETAAKAAMAAIRSELEAEIAALGPVVVEAFTDWAKPPRRDMRVLDARRAKAAELKSAAEKLESRLRGLQQEAEQSAADAGADRHTATAEAIRFTTEFNAMWRAMACDSIVRAAERIDEESGYLKQNFSKWKPERDGSITSSDFAITGRITSLRSQVEFAVRDADELTDRLEGGR